MIAATLLLALQMTVGSTTGILPPATPYESLLLGDDLADFRAAWLTPRNAYQQTWRDSADSRANQTPSGARPTDFGVAATDASIAQAAGLRFAMIGDPADLQKAADVLLLAAVPGSGTSITRPEVMTSYLCAYDLVRGATLVELPQATRDAIEAELWAQAWSLSSGTTNSNAMGKIGATRALAGLLLMDQALLDRGLRNLEDHFRYSTTDDGWFTDSQGHYLNYTLSHLGPFLRAYHQGSGVDLYPNLAPYARMSLGLRYPNGAVPNVSDGLNTPVGIHYFSQSTDAALAAETTWNVFEGAPWTPYWSATNLFNNDWSYTRSFVLTDTEDVGTAEPGESPTFLTRGQSAVSVFRQDWSKSSDYLLLAAGIDSPKGFLGIPAFHSHNDTGELVMCAEGEPMLVAPGYERTDLQNSPPGFTPKRASWHNVLLVDGDVGSSDLGRKQRPGNFFHTERLDSVEGGGWKGACDFASLEMTYRSVRVRRSIAFPGEDYFLVLDRMTPLSIDAHDYAFNLVGRGVQSVLLDAPGAVRTRWEHGASRATATTLGTSPLGSETASLHMHDRFNVFEPTARMKVTQSQQRGGAFLSVLEPGDAGSAEALAVTALATEAGGIAARIDDAAAGWRDLALVQGQGAIRAAGALASDGGVAWMRTRGTAVEDALVAGGTTLAHDGVLLVETSEPATYSVQLGSDALRATFSPDEFDPGTVLRVYGFGSATSALLDGAPVPVTAGETYQSVPLSAVAEGRRNLLELAFDPAPACGYRTYGYGASPMNVLRLTGEGEPATGATVAITASGVAAAEAWLVVSRARGSSPIFGGTLLVGANDLVLQVAAPATAGSASWALAIPNDPGLAGSSFFLQAAARDPSLAGGWALSQGLEAIVCP